MVNIEKKVVKLSYLLSEDAFSSGLIAHSLNQSYFLVLGFDFFRYDLSSGWQMLVLFINRGYEPIVKRLLKGTDISVVEVLNPSDFTLDGFGTFVGQFPVYFVVSDSNSSLNEIRAEASGFELIEVSSDGLDGILKELGEKFLIEGDLVVRADSTD